jgi:hypothetical protein
MPLVYAADARAAHRAGARDTVRRDPLATLRHRRGSTASTAALIGALLRDAIASIVPLMLTAPDEARLSLVATITVVGTARHVTVAGLVLHSARAGPCRGRNRSDRLAAPAARPGALSGRVSRDAWTPRAAPLA